MNSVPVGLTRISSQFPVSDLSEWRHLYMWKETYICEKRPTYATRGFPSQIWVSDVTFVTFSGDQKCNASHLSHFWEKCDALAHENISFNLWHFWSHSSRKTSHFGPAGTNCFWTRRNVTIRLGLKPIFLLPSQICHLSRKREAGRLFRLRLTYIGMCVSRVTRTHIRICECLNMAYVSLSTLDTWVGHYCTNVVRVIYTHIRICVSRVAHTHIRTCVSHVTRIRPIWRELRVPSHYIECHFICVTWLIHMRSMTHPYVWHDSLICVTWLIHLCDIFALAACWHDAFIYAPWLIHVFAMTHWYVWHGSFVYKQKNLQNFCNMRYL